MILITDAAKDIPGFEGLYSITKFGVIYSLPRKGSPKLKFMKPVDNMESGYLRAKLSSKSIEKPKLFYIHQLVATTYIQNPENKPMVNHIDGDKTNNRVENLEWVTAQENHDHAFTIGLYPNQKLHSSQKQEVFELVQNGTPKKQVAEIYGMRLGGVSSLVRRYKKKLLQLAA
jgi:hypothetical protein